MSANRKPPAPPRDDRATRWIGIGIVVFAFGLLGGWAAVAELDGAAVAPGVVQVDSYRQAVEHLDGGLVERIHIRDGDTVERDQILVELDDTVVRAELETVRARHASARAELARLEAERDDRDSFGIVIPDPEAPGDPHYARALAAQSAIFHARKQTLEGELGLHRQRAEALQAQIEGLQAVVAARQESRAFYAEELDELEELLEERLTDRSRARELEQRLVETRGSIAELRSDIRRLEVELAETELQIAQRLSERQTEIVGRLNEVEEQFHDLDEQRRALELRASRTVVRSPAHGVVVNMDVHTEGAVIGAGSRIAEVVPIEDELVVEARVRPEDIDRVAVEQLADVRLTAYSFRMTPVVEGRVLQVSADRLEDSQTGEPYYLARVEVSESERERVLGGQPLLPGMPAEVMIRTGERTLLSYLVRPLLDAVSHAFRES